MADKPAFDFDAMTALYERLAEPVTQRFSERALRIADVSSGHEIIDVAAGPGGLALSAARLGARVLATDAAPGMVARADERLRLFAGCGARAMLCEALDLPDARFDASFSLFGVVLVPERRRGMSELVRVTRRGGCVVVGAWAAGGRDTPMGLLKRVFDGLFPGRPFWRTDPFDWDEHELRRAMAEAGCRDIAVELVTERVPVPALDAFVDESEPFWRLSPGYADLAPEERAEVLGRLRDLLRSEFGQPDGSVLLPMSALIARGVRA